MKDPPIPTTFFLFDFFIKNQVLILLCPFCSGRKRNGSPSVERSEGERGSKWRDVGSLGGGLGDGGFYFQ